MSFADIGKLYLPAMVNCCSAWRRKSNAEYPIPEIADALASSSSGKKCEIAKRFPAMMRRSSRRRRSGWSMLGKPTNVVSVLTAPSVNDPRLKHGGLCLSSTAIRHTGKDVPLWSHRSTHQGVSTRRPCSSSLAGRAAFSVQCSAHQPGQHEGYTGNSDTQKRVLCGDGSHHSCIRTLGKRGYCSEHPPSPPCSPQARLCRRCSCVTQQRPRTKHADCPCAVSRRLAHALSRSSCVDRYGVWCVRE